MNFTKPKMKFHGDEDLDKQNIEMEETKSKDPDKKNIEMEETKQMRKKEIWEDCFRLPLGWCFCYGTQVFHS